MDWDVTGTWISILIAAIGLLGAYIGWRRSELRREEVYTWAISCIDTMQSLFLITLIRKGDGWRFDDATKLEEIIFNTSSLVEQGRLLFKNEKHSHGGEKELAYQGLRPQILDQLIVAHQIALCWEDADKEKRLKLCQLAERSVKRFVSFAQQEVGRVRAASVAAQQGGEGVVLSRLISEQASNLTAYEALQKQYSPR